MANEMIWKFRFKLDDGSRMGRQKQIENFLYYGSCSIQKLLFLAFCTLSQRHTMLHNGLEPNQVNLENELENVRKSHNRLRIVYYYFLFLFLIYIYYFFFYLMEFSFVVRCCEQRTTVNHTELTMRRIVRVPEPRCQADEMRLSSSGACKNDNTWASQPAKSVSQVSQPAQPSQAKPSSPASERPKRRSGSRRSRCRSCRRCRCRCRWSSQPMTLTAAVAATTS